MLFIISEASEVGKEKSFYSVAEQPTPTTRTQIKQTSYAQSC